MRRIVALGLLAVYFCNCTLGAQSLGISPDLLQALPDKENEGDSAVSGQFLRDLRRFEIIFFGTLPFTILFSDIGYSVGRYGYYGFSDGFSSENAELYEPALFGEASYTQDEKLGILLSAMGASVVLATIDFIIEKTKQRQGRTNAAR